MQIKTTFYACVRVISTERNSVTRTRRKKVTNILLLEILLLTFSSFFFYLEIEKNAKNAILKNFLCNKEFLILWSTRSAHGKCPSIFATKGIPAFRWLITSCASVMWQTPGCRCVFVQSASSLAPEISVGPGLPRCNAQLNCNPGGCVGDSLHRTSDPGGTLE